MFLSKIDEKVASSKKHTLFYPGLARKHHTLFETRRAKIDTLFLTKTDKEPCPIAHVWKYPQGFLPTIIIIYYIDSRGGFFIGKCIT